MAEVAIGSRLGAGDELDVFHRRIQQRCGPALSLGKKYRKYESPLPGGSGLDFIIGQHKIVHRTVQE